MFLNLKKNHVLKNKNSSYTPLYKAVDTILKFLKSLI